MTTETVLATLRFEAPLPSKACSPNRGGHWAGKHASKGDYRRDIAMLAMHAMRQWERRTGQRWVPAQRARISLEFGTKNSGLRGYDDLYRPKDLDNAIAAFKPGQDGLVDAGLIADDSYRHLERGTVRIHRESAGVVVTLEVLRWA